MYTIFVSAFTSVQLSLIDQSLLVNVHAKPSLAPSDVAAAPNSFKYSTVLYLQFNGVSQFTLESLMTEGGE